MKSGTLFFLLCFLSFCIVGQNVKNDYFEGRIIVKINPKYAERCKKASIEIPSIQTLVEKLGIKRTEKLFPRHRRVSAEKRLTENFVDLSTIYQFHFDAGKDHEKIIKQIAKDKSVAYAEFEFINRPCFSPNDTLNSSQWYLGAIKAYEAWDINKGDTNIVIAIIDTGSDMEHEDMKDDYALNHDDPINGTDDDNDGYIDNYNGWDLANNDNDPSFRRDSAFSGNAHGLNVASIAGASTNNITGISGVGFNCRMLTIRADPDSTPGVLTVAFQGIVYAADQGAFIINNSWGSYSFSQLGQDIVNYATINKGALVIAAVGNGLFSGPNAGIGIETPFYPAAYENVLSVGALIENDTLKASSNFGYWVDIFAPGEHMFVASGISEYGVNGGTSMAAPVVAGVAALAKSQFPNYSPQQIMHQLLSTADNVEDANEPTLKGKMGVGRVNALEALRNTSSPGIDFINRLITDKNNETFSRGDTLFISGDFKNYLTSASNTTASISTIGNKLKMLNGTIQLGNIGTMDSSSNKSNPFIFVIGSEIAFNEIVVFEISIKANNDSYERKIHFELSINPDFLTVNENNLTVTLSSNGNIGFSGEDNTLGEGIKYLNGNSLLFDGSFMIGNSSNYIANLYRNENGRDNDFSIIEPIQSLSPEIADFKAQTIFNDGMLSASPLLEIVQTNFIFKEESLSNSIVYVFDVKNISSRELDNLHAGLFIDWDIEDFSTNKVIYDIERKMGISYSTDTNLFVGVLSIEDQLNNFHYAIDNSQNGNGGINIVDGISDAEKFQLLSSNREQAGNINAQGNDIADVNSVGPFSLAPDDSRLISFTIIVANDLVELKERADSASAKHEQILLSLAKPTLKEGTINIFPSPANESVSVNFRIEQSENLSLKVYDMQGKVVYERNNQFYTEGEHLIKLKTASWKTGVYIFEIKGSSFSRKNNFVVSH